MASLMQLLNLVLLLEGMSEQTTFKMRLTNEGRVRRDHRIRRRALRFPSMSPFEYLYGSGCDQSLITLTGLDHRAFRALLTPFHLLYHTYTPYSRSGYIQILRNRRVSRGRPRLLSSAQCLAMFLAWHRTRCQGMTLSLTFGATASVVSLYIRFARRLVYHTLQRDEQFRVKLPTNEEVEQFKQAFRERHSLLQDVYCVADGLKLQLQQSGDCVIQNMFYNGWTHDHYVGNMFVFAPNGCVISCAVNAPGAFHDSTIAEWGNIYRNLQVVFENTGGRCVVDSAFCREAHPFLIKSAQDYLGSAQNAAEAMVARQATSARQGAEWGMRAFQGTFPRLKVRLTYEENGERKMILLTTVLLFNFRSHVVGINQILNTYMPNMGAEANLFLHDSFGF